LNITFPGNDRIFLLFELDGETKDDTAHEFEIDGTVLRRWSRVPKERLNALSLISSSSIMISAEFAFMDADVTVIKAVIDDRMGAIKKAENGEYWEVRDEVKLAFPCKPCFYNKKGETMKKFVIERNEKGYAWGYFWLVGKHVGQTYAPPKRMGGMEATQTSLPIPVAAPAPVPTTGGYFTTQTSTTTPPTNFTTQTSPSATAPAAPTPTTAAYFTAQTTTATPPTNSSATSAPAAPTPTTAAYFTTQTSTTTPPTNFTTQTNPSATSAPAAPPPMPTTFTSQTRNTTTPPVARAPTTTTYFTTTQTNPSATPAPAAPTATTTNTTKSNEPNKQQTASKKAHKANSNNQNIPCGINLNGTGDHTTIKKKLQLKRRVLRAARSYRKPGYRIPAKESTTPDSAPTPVVRPTPGVPPFASIPKNADAKEKPPRTLKKPSPKEQKHKNCMFPDAPSYAYPIGPIPSDDEDDRSLYTWESVNTEELEGLGFEVDDYSL
jgi:hypothetical protein